jgi:hypothetical protein
VTPGATRPFEHWSRARFRSTRTRRRTQPSLPPPSPRAATLTISRTGLTSSSQAAMCTKHCHPRSPSPVDLVAADLCGRLTCRISAARRLPTCSDHVLERARVDVLARVSGRGCRTCQHCGERKYRGGAAQRGQISTHSYHLLYISYWITRRSFRPHLERGAASPVFPHAERDRPLGYQKSIIGSH